MSVRALKEALSTESILERVSLLNLVWFYREELEKLPCKACRLNIPRSTVRSLRKSGILKRDPLNTGVALTPYGHRVLGSNIKARVDSLIDSLE
jgi:hypothetical protein